MGRIFNDEQKIRKNVSKYKVGAYNIIVISNGRKLFSIRTTAGCFKNPISIGRLYIFKKTVVVFI